MEQITNAACLNGCRSAPNQQHGCYFSTKVSVLRIIFIITLVLSCRAFSDEGVIERASIGQIVDFSGNAEIMHSSASYTDGMQIGGKIYPDDILRTGNGSIEITFGINSRVRLGSNTELKVVSLVQKSENKSGLLYQQSNYYLFLKTGIIRVRVRENYITSTIINITAGDIRVIAPRSDLVFSRSRKIGSSISYVGLLVAWGRIVANKKNVNDTEWNPNNSKEVRAGFTALIPENDVEDNVISWEKIDITEAAEAIRELPFSVDTNNQIIDDIKEKSPELQGA